MPQCPKCGGSVYERGTSQGKSRYSHRGPNDRAKRACNWHGTAPVGLEHAQAEGIAQATSQALHRKIRRARGVQRYVVTAAQNATPIRRGFFASLLTYCKANGAQLIVIPYRYKNPTSMWSDKAQADDWWAPELAPYLMNVRTELNKHLVILADIMTQPTASSPLQGFETLVGAKSAIIGHPKLELTTVPTPQARLPKLLTTTGACTEKNYIAAKAGKKAEHHHTFGAAVVEVSGSKFHLRQLNALDDGSFMDLNYNYTPTGHVKVEQAAALIMGDSHVEFIDPEVVKATWGKGGLLDVLKPKVLVWHDVHDFYSRNHHHRHDPIINYVKHHSGADNVERALDETFKFVDDHTREGTLNVFAASNHPDALARWVKETDPREDPENCVFWAETYKQMCLGSTMGVAGAETIDPFVYWAHIKLPGTTSRSLGGVGRPGERHRFLARDESFMVKDIELGNHGDKGPNGARGTRNAFSKIGVKTVIAHIHAPGITGGAYQVGTNSRLKLEYNIGPSSWLHSDCVEYANGKRSLINIIDGEWHA